MIKRFVKNLIKQCFRGGKKSDNLLQNFYDDTLKQWRYYKFILRRLKRPWPFSFLLCNPPGLFAIEQLVVELFDGIM